MSIREVFIRRTIIFCITSELTKGSHDKDKMWNEKGTDFEKRLLKFSAKGVQIQHLLDMFKNAILSKQFVRQAESVVSKQYQKRWCYADKPNLFSTIPASCSNEVYRKRGIFYKPFKRVGHIWPEVIRSKIAITHWMHLGLHPIY